MRVHALCLLGGDLAVDHGGVAARAAVVKHIVLAVFAPFIPVVFFRLVKEVRVALQHAVFGLLIDVFYNIVVR